MSGIPLAAGEMDEASQGLRLVLPEAEYYRRVLYGRAMFGRLLSLVLLGSVAEGLKNTVDTYGLYDQDTVARESLRVLEELVNKATVRALKAGCEELAGELQGLWDIIMIRVRRNAAIEMGDLVNLALDLADEYLDPGEVGEAEDILVLARQEDQEKLQRKLEIYINKIKEMINLELNRAIVECGEQR